MYLLCENLFQNVRQKLDILKQTKAKRINSKWACARKSFKEISSSGRIMIPNKNLGLHQAMNNSRNDKNKQTTTKKTQQKHFQSFPSTQSYQLRGTDCLLFFLICDLLLISLFLMLSLMCPVHVEQHRASSVYCCSQWKCPKSFPIKVDFQLQE